ncbi:XRE family transcriptional regulator [Paenibacillus hemerocallicola]|uniref:XRE family transcriptional regulator n=1 Tax=Paenibacillus hemerocallicola TaxID=1172614 RepID=A0A5C4TGT4_9BACL|nr:XRE family transcriptional regulator [Paenibacillus hemerocallicola]TNJ68188.1 XRE family transcriptional regulator [Paenibacillus hemerocallicola]
MFPNLEAEMARKRITKGDISKFLGVRYATVIDKTKGKSRFTIDEALKIKTHFFPNCSVEYLFEINEHTA